MTHIHTRQRFCSQSLVLLSKYLENSNRPKIGIAQPGTLMDTRKSLGMVFRCISMDLGRTLTFNINFRPPPPSEGPPDSVTESRADRRSADVRIRRRRLTVTRVRKVPFFIPCLGHTPRSHSGRCVTRGSSGQCAPSLVTLDLTAVGAVPPAVWRRGDARAPGRENIQLCT